jgi:hypothetical protein
MTMNDSKPQQHESDKDRLVSRPDGELPAALDPAGPEAHGYPADPKPDASQSPGLPDGSSQGAADLGRTA